MDLALKLDLLGRAAQYDACVEAGQPAPFPGKGVEHDAPARDGSRYISDVIAQGGRKMPVMKVLQTSACEKDCYYCPFRAGRNFRRETLSPDELARAFNELRRKKLVEGLFLSSGIIGTARSQDKMLETVELVRRKYDFQGYIHLKLLPNAEDAHIERAVQLADRVSVNLEAPNAERLAKLAPKKEFFDGLIATLRRTSRVIRAGEGRVATAGQTTQLVVGGAGESDQEILATAQQLYDEMSLARIYYSAFRPVPDTPLDGQPAESPAREHRLYQSDFLMRYYRFWADELPLDEKGHLSLDKDPKQAWADAHPERFPIEVNRVGKSALLRIPGVGPVGARRILDARRQGRIRTLEALAQLGIPAAQVAPYVLLDGRKPPVQLSLF